MGTHITARRGQAPDMTVTDSAGTPAFFSSFCICGANGCQPCKHEEVFNLHVADAFHVVAVNRIMLVASLVTAC